MALKKSQLYSSLWASCDELRGGMDASQYKDYVLTLLFMKYVSDKYAGKADGAIEVPAGGGFADMVALKGKKDIGEGIDKIISKLAEANGLKGVIDVASFNDDDKLGKGSEMVDRLSKLVGIFETLDFGANRAEGDDLLGDAYEYLMRHFATESGKSKGQFYTPAEVSRIMAKVVGIGPQTKPHDTIYDPTCGSGSLLLKAADEAPRGMSIYGQENDLATWALARMNMFLHGHATADLWKGNTLSAPYFKKKDGSLETFDFAVANPPFSAKSWSNGVNVSNDEFKRFEYGVPPTKNGDFAFLLHLIKSLKSTGKGAIILPHGVLFRGNKEADIRRNLIKQGYIKGIIGLPPNLFYGTGIPACIVVIDKENAHARTGIFMIDASKAFVKDGNKNRLRAQDIHKIVDVFNRQLEWPHYSRMVPVSEIASPTNDYNLNIPRYIDSSELEDLHDLDAHLHGGIPNRDVDALSIYWQVFPSLRAELFEAGDRAGYSRAKVETQKVKPTILRHPEFAAYSQKVAAIFDEWRNAHEVMLKKLREGAKPKLVILKLSEDLLQRFSPLPLLDNYDAYQRLMDYWTGVMQDDVYLIGSDGWVEAAKPRLAIDNKEKNIRETPDLTVERKKYKMDLIPPKLIVARYFAPQQAEVGQLELKREAADLALEEFVEENNGEEGLLEAGKTDKGTLTKASLSERLREIENDAESEEEKKVLTRCLQLMETEAVASKAVKESQAYLDASVLTQYAKLTDSEIRDLVVDDKWLAVLQGAMKDEIQRLTQALTDRVKELEERYIVTLSELENAISELSDRVKAHLKEMGQVVA
ncbi:MAG: type I restriction-modification system subunit M [Acidobacteria bacterium]|nr:type I restriction-modification system subunit M [Acidobacteriota bacterium]